MEDYNKKIKNLTEDLNKKVIEIGEEYLKAELEVIVQKANERVKGKEKSELFKDLIKELSKVSVPISILNIQKTIYEIIVNSIALGIKSIS